MSDRLLIATDLDRTLLPNGFQEESPGARVQLAHLVDDVHVSLAYVSGRHRELVEAAMAEWSLPRPDHVIGDVGTSLWRVEATGAWYQNRDWEAAIAEDWGAVRAPALAERLASVPGWKLQPPEQQGQFKVSYFVPPDTPMDDIAPRLQEQLEAEGVRARFVFSVDETREQGLVDVLPARASKLHAIEAIMEHEGLSEEEVVFCGDSGNDLEVLVSSLPAVLVANATEAVREAALAGAQAAGTQERLYCARGGYNGMNGCYAAGMLEGIAHFHPQAAARLAPVNGQT